MRAIEISNPFILREVGYFINAPVQTVRWASWGITGEFVPFRGRSGPGAHAANRGATDGGRIQLRAFPQRESRLRGYQQRSLYPQMQMGICLTGNPGAIAAGYEPCSPYGKWDSPANAWTKTGIATP